MFKLEIIAIVGLLVFGLWFQHGELKAAKAEVAAREAEVKSLRDESRAAEIGAAVAKASKERVREVVRTVQLPPVTQACRDDPAVLGAYDAIQRMRDAAAAGGPPYPAPPAGAQPPRGAVLRPDPVG
jgi:FtsZ-interacting cell division protein ZipA